MTVNDAVTELRGVGDAQAKLFARLGVVTLGDLIQFYPRRYEDYSVITPISQLSPGVVTIEGKIKQATGRYVRRGMHITEAVVSDETGSARLVWFNQPYRAAALKRGQPYFISGKYELSRQRFAIQNPTVERVSDLPVNTARIVPVYRETKGLTSRQIRAAVQQIVALVEATVETLPPAIIKKERLLSRAAALKTLHAPASAEDLAEARRRLGFEEVFQLSLASLLNKQENQREQAEPIPFKPALAAQFSKSLPFKLTNDQRVAVMRIYKDLEKGQPMNRLLEGDVGSGKTVVATMAALMALEQGLQVALMAPTELLARQHADTIYRLLQAMQQHEQVVLLVGSMTAAQKTKARQAIKAGKANFIIGTHALIQDQVDMKNLALVAIHRSGSSMARATMLTPIC